MNFPEARIDLVLDANIAPLFENHPDVDRVIAFTNEEKHRFFHYLAKVRQVVRSTRYDAIIDMRSTIQTLWFSLFSIRTKYRIGRKKSYNWLISNYRPKISKNIDMVVQDLMLARPLQKIKPIHECRDFSMPVSETEKMAFRSYMERNGVDFNRPVVFCAVATRIPWKVWDKERMKAVLRLIIERYDACLIFNYGGDEERRYVEMLYNEMDCDSHIAFGVEAKGLPQLKAMLANCDFFFGNEGGPRHLAQALGVPSFAIYPPHISKTVWLPSNGGMHQGIEVADIESSRLLDKKPIMQSDLHLSQWKKCGTDWLLMPIIISRNNECNRIVRIEGNYGVLRTRRFFSNSHVVECALFFYASIGSPWRKGEPREFASVIKFGA